MSEIIVELESKN